MHTGYAALWDLFVTYATNLWKQESPDEFGIINPSISSLEKEDFVSTEDTESFQENEPVVTPKARSPRPRAIHGSISNDLLDLKPIGQGSPLVSSPFARNLGAVNGKSTKFSWPPPPSSPPPGPPQSTTPRRYVLLDPLTHF